MRQEVSPEKCGFAKTLRTNATDAERKLWSVHRAGQLGGFKFRRQVPHSGYVLDFVCFELRLIIEADGGQHAGSDSDSRRDAAPRSEGFLTLRLWNNDILGNPDRVATEILRVARQRLRGSR